MRAAWGFATTIACSEGRPWPRDGAIRRDDGALLGLLDLDETPIHLALVEVDLVVDLLIREAHHPELHHGLHLDLHLLVRGDLLAGDDLGLARGGFGHSALSCL